LLVNWKNLQNLASNSFPTVEHEPGVYFLRWKKGENPVIINRFGGSDKTGLLYVGQSKNLRRRFQRIWKGINQVNIWSDKIPHTLNRTILFCKLHEEINSDEYEIAWQHFSTKLEAQVQEAAALQLYSEKYKEPPPLNLQVCRPKYVFLGRDSSDQSNWHVKPNKFVKSIIV
jgi:hypothetical protein